MQLIIEIYHYKHLYRRINSADLIETFDNIQLATRWIESQLITLSAAIKSIRIDGPFQNIPQGVVICDTPGLGDSDHQRSRRTLSMLPTFNEVWFLEPLALSLSEDKEQKIIHKLISDNIKFKIIITKSRSEIDDSDELDQPVNPERNIRANIIRSRAAKPIDAMTEEERAHWNQILPELQQYVQSVPIVFTEFNGVTVGLDTCCEWLRDISRDLINILEEKKDMYNALLNRISNTGM